MVLVLKNGTVKFVSLENRGGVFEEIPDISVIS
jgi:hypothetical protein